jgi:hypothetical protein
MGIEGIVDPIWPRGSNGNEGFFLGFTKRTQAFQFKRCGDKACSFSGGQTAA